MERKRNRVIGIVIILGIILVAGVFVISKERMTHTDSVISAEYGTSSPMDYAGLLEKCQTNWGLDQVRAMRELADIGISDQKSNEKEYKLVWLQFPGKDENKRGGYLQFICHLSQDSNAKEIDKILGVALGSESGEDAMYYRGPIKVWWRDGNYLEFACNGEFGTDDVDPAARLLPLSVEKGEHKEVNSDMGESFQSKDYCYAHHNIQL